MTSGDTASGDTASGDTALVDPDWYRVRYPDVVAAGADPAAHYAAHGRAEGRHPTPAAALAALGEAVDPAWYRARYPDVAATGIDPVRHYLLDGRAEGRHPNADAEPRDVWDARFDPVWYRARNPDLGPYRDDPLEHFRRVGLIEGRAANAAEEDRGAWRGVLDPEWYRARNPDIARRGLDPLEHFITRGIIDRRRPNPGVVLPSEPVAAVPIDRLKGGTFGAGGSGDGASRGIAVPEVALFVTHAPDGAVKPHVAHHVACLRRCGIACALIVACDAPGAAITGEAAETADHVFRRANAGFDFAAWAHVLRLHPELFEAPVLYLVNDSVFGPTSPEALAAAVDRVRASAADVVGLTDNADRGWHVQSYFLALKAGFLASRAGRDFLGEVVSYAHKDDVVNEYETRLARRALDAGLLVEVLFPTPDWLDATLHNWRRLLRAGFPYLKVGTARGLVPGVETAGWRAEMAARGYDTGPADRTLARLASGAGAAPGAAEAGGAAGVADAAADGRACLAEMHAFLADGGAIPCPAVPTPAVSFLAVTGGRPARLLRLLRALTEGADGRGGPDGGAPAGAEYIVVDNAATDDTHHVLGRVTGATVLTHVAPLPSARAARRAAARARAELAVLLMPDAPLADGTAPDAPGPGEPVGSSPAAASEPARGFRHVLEGLAPGGTGPIYVPRAAPQGAPWATFDVVHRGRRVGAAHAFARCDAPSALAALLGGDGTPESAGASPPGVL